MTVGTFHSQQQTQQHTMMQNLRNCATNFYGPQPVNQQYHLLDTKGLLNGPGQNNCFLNCAVQVSVFDLLTLNYASINILLFLFQTYVRHF